MNDILVIGGGIAGVSAAARLSADADVTLLEMEDALGYHASGRSAALFEQNYGEPSTVTLNRASAPYHREANGGYLSPRGLMIIAQDAERAAFKSDIKTMGLEEIDPADARLRVPILDAKVTLAGFHEAAYDIDTDRMIQDFVRELRRNGGKTVTASAVTEIRQDADGWTVTAGGEEYRAREIVNAAGAWADLIAGIAGVTPLGIVPHRRSMARLAAPGGHDVSGWPMLFGVGETWYAKPDAGALLVSPADEDATHPHDAFADDMTLAEGLARYQELVTEEVTRPIANWAGLRSFAPDRNLVLGRDPEVPSFVWCAAQGGYGFQTSPAASQFLADLVNGRPHGFDDATFTALTPDRLRV